MPIVQEQIKTPIRQYSDIDISFRPHPARKDLAKKVGDQAVIQALKNLVMLNFYEKPFQPHIACNARGLLFENLSPITANLLKDLIVEVIRNYEPRVTLSNTIVVADYDSNSYRVTIEFYINNRTEPTTTSFILERIR